MTLNHSMRTEEKKMVNNPLRDFCFFFFLGEKECQVKRQEGTRLGDILDRTGDFFSDRLFIYGRH